MEIRKMSEEKFFEKVLPWLDGYFDKNFSPGNYVKLRKLGMNITDPYVLENVKRTLCVMMHILENGLEKEAEPSAGHLVKEAGTPVSYENCEEDEY